MQPCLQELYHSRFSEELNLQSLRWQHSTHPILGPTNWNLTFQRHGKEMGRRSLRQITQSLVHREIFTFQIQLSSSFGNGCSLALKPTTAKVGSDCTVMPHLKHVRRGKQKGMIRGHKALKLCPQTEKEKEQGGTKKRNTHGRCQNTTPNPHKDSIRNVQMAEAVVNKQL